MISKNEDDSVDFDHVEKWLENYFLDPLTTYYDQTHFQIDLYETEKEWIVEAILTEYLSSEIIIFIEKKKLLITAAKHSPSSNQQKQKRIRTIDFPFQIIHQKVTATFTNGILEVFISKVEKENKKNRFITLT